MTISFGDLGGVVTYENNNFQLGLAAEELVEEAAKPGYGDERHQRSPRWWWTRVQNSSVRHASEITQLPLPRHHFLSH